jgi:hypothetical protein
MPETRSAIDISSVDIISRADSVQIDGTEGAPPAMHRRIIVPGRPNYDWADLYGETTGYGFELGRSYASADCQLTDVTHVERLIGDRALKDLGARAEVRIVVQLDHQAVH